MNNTGEKIIIALDAVFDGEEKKAEAILFNYLNNSAGNYHIFVPNVTAAIASKYLYAFSTTAVNADITAGRFTVLLEYAVF